MQIEVIKLLLPDLGNKTSLYYIEKKDLFLLCCVSELTVRSGKHSSTLESQVLRCLVFDNLSRKF